MNKFNLHQKVKVLKTGEVGEVVGLPEPRRTGGRYSVELISGDDIIFLFKESELVAVGECKGCNSIGLCVDCAMGKSHSAPEKKTEKDFKLLYAVTSIFVGDCLVIRGEIVRKVVEADPEWEAYKAIQYPSTIVQPEEKKCVCGYHVNCSPENPCSDCQIHSPEKLPEGCNEACRGKGLHGHAGPLGSPEKKEEKCDCSLSQMSHDKGCPKS